MIEAVFTSHQDTMKRRSISKKIQLNHIHDLLLDNVQLSHNLHQCYTAMVQMSRVIIKCIFWVLIKLYQNITMYYTKVYFLSTKKVKEHTAGSEFAVMNCHKSLQELQQSTQKCVSKQHILNP